MTRRQRLLLGLGIQGAINALVIWAVGSIGIGLTTAAVSAMAIFGGQITELGTAWMVGYSCAMIAVFALGIWGTVLWIKRSLF